MAPTKRLFRRPSSGRIAGVCAGLAEYLDSDVTLVRVLWVIVSIVPGCIIGGLLAYLIAWIIVPEATEPAQIDPAARRLTRSVDNRKLGGVCGGIAEYFDVDATAVRLAWAVLSVIPGTIVLGLLAYLAAWFIIPEDRVPHAATASPATPAA